MALGGHRLCPEGIWAPVYKGPSFGFIYVTNMMNEKIEFKWKAGSAAPPFYWKGSRTIGPGEKVAVGYGLPTPYVSFKIKALKKDIRIFVS